MRGKHENIKTGVFKESLLLSLTTFILMKGFKTLSNSVCHLLLLDLISPTLINCVVPNFFSIKEVSDTETSSESLRF